MNFRKLRTWVVGGIGAVVNAGVGGVAIVIVDPTDFNPFEWAGFVKLAKVCVALGLVGFGLYVKEHPIPVDTILEDEEK